MMSTPDDLAMVSHFLAQGGTLQTLVNVDMTDLDSLYAYACQLFEAKEYAKAKYFYSLLASLSHWQFEYWLALGLTCQHLSEHEQAVVSFSQAGALQMDDPMPPYLAGISYQAMARIQQAYRAFSTALSRCSEQHDPLQMQIQQKIDVIIQDVEL